MESQISRRQQVAPWCVQTCWQSSNLGIFFHVVLGHTGLFIPYGKRCRQLVFLVLKSAKYIAVFVFHQVLLVTQTPLNLLQFAVVVVEGLLVLHKNTVTKSTFRGVLDDRGAVWKLFVCFFESAQRQQSAREELYARFCSTICFVTFTAYC